MWAGKYKTTGHGSLIIGDEFGNIIFVSDPAPGCDHDMKKREGEVKKILDLAGSVIADKGFQGSGYVTPAKKPQDRELYMREYEYNNQISSIRAPIERAVAHLKTWKILFADYRRPLNTFVSNRGTRGRSRCGARWALWNDPRRHVTESYGPAFDGCRGYGPGP